MIRKEPSSKPNKVMVIFEYPAGNRIESVHLVGDFNNWNETTTPMALDKRAGLWHVRMDLDKGNEYQFRYLVNQSTWHNDWHADRYVPNIHGSDNSVIST